GLRPRPPATACTRCPGDGIQAAFAPWRAAARPRGPDVGAGRVSRLGLLADAGRDESQMATRPAVFPRLPCSGLRCRPALATPRPHASRPALGIPVGVSSRDGGTLAAPRRTLRLPRLAGRGVPAALPGRAVLAAGGLGRTPLVLAGDRVPLVHDPLAVSR